eukprot:SAG31_NODE_11554_length_1018_cov_1.129489_1_plen_149_part_10
MLFSVGKMIRLSIPSCISEQCLGVSLIGLVVAKIQKVVENFERQTFSAAWDRLEAKAIARYDLDGNGILVFLTMLSLESTMFHCAGEVDQNEFVLALLLEVNSASSKPCLHFLRALCAHIRLLISFWWDSCPRNRAMPLRPRASLDTWN